MIWLTAYYQAGVRERRPQTARHNAFLRSGRHACRYVYQHVLAWREASEPVELTCRADSNRQSGGLFVNALARETGHTCSPEEAERIHQVHSEAFAACSWFRWVLRNCWTYLPRLVCHGPLRHLPGMESASLSLRLLGLNDDVPIITRDMETCQTSIWICSSQS